MVFDFVAYRHHPALVHSEYAVLALSDEDANTNARLKVWSDFHCTLRLCGSVAKTLLVLHVSKNCNDTVSPWSLEHYSVEERIITRWNPELEMMLMLLLDLIFCKYRECLAGGQCFEKLELLHLVEDLRGLWIYDECQMKHGNANAWRYSRYCTDAFDYLTLSAIVNGTVLCVHGGLSPDVRATDQVGTGSSSKLFV
ncbi:splicing endonuclease 1 [Perilla frutescens var. hirtella]|uniref:Splicing endonuclease 1 n=1 Tax=Perilla frutescens var. hirtella TaxID=608512 RepID=A0AAD4J126_PERFH|nr:splicing endonuclease 1 [Perilla frutescens var. hirtella]